MRRSLLWLGLLPLSCAPLSATAQDSGRALEIVRELDRRSRGYGDFRAELEMRVSGEGDGPRLRQMSVLGFEAERGDYTLIVLQRPADLAGTRFLSVTERDGERNQWIYLPTVRRARRIGGGQGSDPFLGSHFTYDDMAPPKLEGFAYAWERDQEIEGRPGALIARCEGTCQGASARQLLWIETERYVLRRVDYFDLDGVRRKSLELSDYTQVEGFWRPLRLEMVDLKDGGRTVLLWSEYEIGVGLRERDFDPSRLGRGR